MSTKTFNLSLPDELVRQLDQRAKKEMTSRSDIMRRAALQYVRGNPLDIWENLSPKTSQLARQAGVFTEQDVVDLTKKTRAEIASERANRES